MADKNFNSGHQSHQDWEKERNRSNQENDWSSQKQGGYQNRGSNQGYRDVGYSGDSARGMDAEGQGGYDRVNYLPDNDDNRQYDDRGFGSSQQGNSGNYGYRASGQDYNAGGYRSEQRGQYGQAGNNSGQWNQQQRRDYDGGYSNQYNQDSDWNRRNQQQSGAGNWGADYGRQDWGRGHVSSGYDHQRDWGNRGYGGSYSNMGNDNRSWDNNRNRYDGGDRRSFDDRDGGRNWWEKTKDKVSSWFDNDEDNNDRGRSEYRGAHRGKGPSDYRRSQDRIREDVCDRLTDDDRVDASNIRVQIEDDAVILSGTVSSREEKRRAEDIVESISGVRNVENRLRVGSGSLASHDYTGNTDRTGGIGLESGTTNEVIRNVQNDKTAGNDRTKQKNP